MKRLKIKELLNSTAYDSEVVVKGWVRTKRGSKNVAFIALNDGSTINNVQVVIEVEKFGEELLKQINTGAALAITGILVQSQGNGQNVEITATTVKVLGEADPDQFPIQPKKHSLEFLREKAHLRLRTSTFGAIMRVRHHLAYAIHKYFHENDFYYFHSPIITGSDCEGAGEMFHITNFDLANIPTNENGVAYDQDFFAKPVHLTVSGQLEGELGAMSLGQVYTFGPTFRAENSNTSRHLAEFWMIEPEVAFNDLNDNMDLAEDFMKSVIKYALEHCEDDLNFLAKRETEEQKKIPQTQRHELSLLERLKFVIENDFVRVTYTDAVKELLNSKPHKKGKFEYPVEWGIDLQSEHERYLVEKKYKKPVIITDYPKNIKSFYMKLNEDGKTVGAMDVLFPGIGEIIGGSEREDDLDVLTTRMKEVGIPLEELDWYLDTRRFGTAPHAGFGLGFERLVLFVTGMTNIRDVIPFPRTPQHAAF